MTLTTTDNAYTMETTEGTTDRRKIALLGGVAALVLGAGGWFLLGGSGGSDGPRLGLPPGGLAKPAAVTPHAKVAKVSAKAVTAVTLPAISTAKLGRDPFHALYVVPAAAPAGTAATGTTSSSPGATTGTTSTSSAPTTAAAPYSLQLLSITGTGAQSKAYAFTVGGAKKVVIAGQKFGKYGELVVLAYVTNSKNAVVGARVQVGDDDPIDVAIGQKIAVL